MLFGWITRKELFEQYLEQNINKTKPRTKFEDSKMRTTLWGPVEMFNGSHSQKEQFLWELDSRLWMEVLARQEGQFVGVLARCRNTYRSGPVPVQVAHLEGQPVKKFYFILCVCVWVETSELLQLKKTAVNQNQFLTSASGQGWGLRCCTLLCNEWAGRNPVESNVPLGRSPPWREEKHVNSYNTLLFLLVMLLTRSQFCNALHI